MSQFWRRVVDVNRGLLERTAALDAAHTCNSSVEMWWERRDLDIRVGAHGVDDE